LCCLIFAVPAFAGDGDSSFCEPCLNVDSSISPTPVFQQVSGTTVGEPNNEYSYAFCAVGGAQYEFATCPDVPGCGCTAGYDTALAVEPAGCGPSLACNDDHPTCTLIFRSHLVWTAPASGNYVLVIDGFSSTGAGTYTIGYRGAACQATPVESVSWGMLKANYE
jgi:hypothetical protein